jgi:hypothetical protein
VQELEYFDTIAAADLAWAPDGETDRLRRLAEPERNLRLAILTDALARYRLYTTTRGAMRSRFVEAERWIFSDDRKWCFSFVNVCEALGLAPLAVRRAVAAGRLTCATRLRTTAQSKRAPRRHRASA